MGAPIYGILPKATFVNSAPLSEDMSGYAMMLLTITSPVSAHTTTVSQKVPVDDTSAWRTGFRVFAAAATMGADPSPDSLENRPLAMPNRAAVMTDEPTNPPPAALEENAEEKMVCIASQR